MAGDTGIIGDAEGAWISFLKKTPPHEGEGLYLPKHPLENRVHVFGVVAQVKQVFEFGV